MSVRTAGTDIQYRFIILIYLPSIMQMYQAHPVLLFYQSLKDHAHLFIILFI